MVLATQGQITLQPIIQSGGEKSGSVLINLIEKITYDHSPSSQDYILVVRWFC